MWLIDEDGIVEWLQVIFYLISSILLLFTGLRSLREDKLIGYLFITIALGCLFMVGEELSWGQRIYQLEVLEFIRQFNSQDETNIHNLRIFQRYRHWLLVFFGFIGIVFAYNNVRIGSNYTNRLFHLIKPSQHLFLILLLIIIFGLAPEIGYIIRSNSDNPINALAIHMKFARSTEIGELLVSIVCITYAFCKFRNVSNYRF